MIHRAQKSSHKCNESYADFLSSEFTKDEELKYVPKYRYKLYCVITHVGEMHLGHYLTYVRYQYHDFYNWIMFDGDNTCPVDEHIVLQTIPYLLIYERDDNFIHSVAYERTDITLKNVANEYKKQNP